MGKGRRAGLNFFMRQVYLDHQASTPVLPEVFDAMKPFFTEAFGNPSSLHQHGLRVRDALAKVHRDRSHADGVNALPPTLKALSCGSMDGCSRAVDRMVRECV